MMVSLMMLTTGTLADAIHHILAAVEIAVAFLLHQREHTKETGNDTEAQRMRQVSEQRGTTRADFENGTRTQCRFVCESRWLTCAQFCCPLAPACTIVHACSTTETKRGADGRAEGRWTTTRTKQRRQEQRRRQRKRTRMRLRQRLHRR